jgi:hypothetical protein
MAPLRPDRQLAARLAVVAQPSDMPGARPAPSVPAPLPALSGLRVSPATFTLTGRRVAGGCVRATRATRHHPRCTRPVVLTVGYMLSGPASVTLTIERTARGRLVTGVCRAPTQANCHLRDCTRVTGRATLRRTGQRGADEFTLPPQVGQLKLSLGTHRLLATPTAARRTGSPQSTTFQIARPEDRPSTAPRPETLTSRAFVPPGRHLLCAQ